MRNANATGCLWLRRRSTSWTDATGVPRPAPWGIGEYASAPATRSLVLSCHGNVKTVVPPARRCILGVSRKNNTRDPEETMTMAWTSRRTFLTLLAGCLLAGPIVPAATAADKLRVLIVDGQNNHDWRMMTPPMKADLEKSGRFTVDVVTTPPAKSPESAWDAFRPDFRKYDVVLSNYNGEPWPREVQKALEEYVSKGGGLSIIHAANNSFPAWPD